MPAEIVKQVNNEITVQFTLKLTGSMLHDEQALQNSINEAGQAAMAPMIKQFDTNGEPIRINGIKHTVKDYAPQTYETPYGPVQVERYTYQTSKGGRAYVPLENEARMVLNSTPKYSQIVSGKYARFGADSIREDLLECNGRDISRNYAKKLSDFVGSIAQCYESEWAKDNWTFLKKYTKRLLLDFYHAREYISKAASAIFGRDKINKKIWEHDFSHNLKHKQGSAGRFIKELEKQRANLAGKNFIERDEEIRQVITYYKNHKSKMFYARHIKDNLPIGSGVTEAACKTLVKQRMCISGSRWKDAGASCVLALRTLKLTTGRWQQFWGYVMRHGCTLS